MNRSGKIVISVLKTIAVPIALFAAMMIIFPKNVRPVTFVNMLYQAVTPAVLAWGVSFNMKVGNWDFSVGAVAMTAAIVGGNIALSLNLGPMGMLVLCAAIGILCGMVTGGLYLLLKIPTIIVSLGVLLVLESLSAIIYNGGGVLMTNDYVVLSSVPMMLIFGACIFALAIILYFYRPFGYHVRAVGNGAAIAAQEGIDIFKVKFKVIVNASFFAGLFAFVTLARTGVWKASTSPMSTMGTCFDAMMCVFIGMSLASSSNIIAGTFVGAVLLQMIKLLIIIAKIKSTATQVVIAVFVLVFMCISNRAEMKRALSLAKKRVQA